MVGAPQHPGQAGLAEGVATGQHARHDATGRAVGVQADRAGWASGGLFGGWRCHTRRRHLHVGDQSHCDVTLYMLYGESLMEYTGWCQNDFNVQG